MYNLVAVTLTVAISILLSVILTHRIIVDAVKEVILDKAQRQQTLNDRMKEQELQIMQTEMKLKADLAAAFMKDLAELQVRVENYKWNGGFEDGNVAEEPASSEPTGPVVH